MQSLFENPVFPLFNQIFHSPYWENISFRDSRFLPKTLPQWILYPIFWALSDKPVVSEVPFRDARAAITMIMVVTMVVVWSFRPNRSAFAVPLRLLGIFWAVSYMFWLFAFSIYRYLVPLELLSGVLIVGVIHHLASKKFIITGASLAVLLVFLYISTEPLEWGHKPFGPRYIDVTAPDLSPDSLVIAMGDYPVSFVIPFFNPKIRFVGMRNNLLQPNQNNLLAAQVKAIIKNHYGPIFVLESPTVSQDELTLSDKELALTRTHGECLPVGTNLETEPLLLCPVKKRTEINGQQPLG
jgi:hypothetical protein